ncbi:DUF58 domain-containing protein [Bifidobacterium bombi]|uniref:DUF58 domain-containing protein n=1 Tax=Bifidobacterium bombi DSM 19703 TaxID=1341695 RepID=A0A080N679_9BIFI|nr:DUF58 domain-containing protein [Bifidobacterium bombi]KFF31354.1 hypothetical protein BBOMB_0701 [Bifidobacterium bombi DSM 19703]
MIERTRRFLTAFGHMATAYVTPFGWLVFIAGASWLALFPRLGWYELLTGGVLALTMVASGIIMSLGNTRLESTLSLSADRVTAGDAVTINVTVSNPGKTPTTRAWGDLPLGDLHEQFRIPALPAGGRESLEVDFIAKQRAVLDVGPLTVRKGDPFGLVRHRRSIAERTKVYIHPKTVSLNPLESAMVRDLEGSPSGQIVDDDLDFYGLRDYHDGDDIRNIHWLSSAKSGRMMVRQYEATKRTDTSLTLDTDPKDYTGPDQFELAVSVLASLGVQCLEQNRPLTAHAASATVRPSSPLALLDWCSAIKPHFSPSRDMAVGTLKGNPASSCYFLVVGPLVPQDALRRIASAFPKAAACIIIRIDTTAERAIRQYDDFTSATLGSIEDLQLVMEAIS